MPITFVTGKPGSGKTLLVISEVERIRKETGRPVFYYNIPDVTLPWSKLEKPGDCHSCPQNSIIVMDEVQQFFPNRKPGSAVPDIVQPFDTHRHRGHDFYLLTQFPTFADFFIRNLSDKHIHLRRHFGMEYSTKLTWQEVKNPNDRENDLEAVKERFSFPKEFYGVYKSADVHTIQKKLPWKKLAVIAAMVVAVPVLILWGISSIQRDEVGGVTPGSELQLPGVTPERPVVVESRAAYNIESFKPRVDGLAHTAPAFDLVNTVQVMPKIGGCMHIEKNGKTWKCYCNSQQGTRLPLSQSQCVHYMANGWFDYTDPDKTTDPGDDYYEQQWQRGGQQAAPALADSFSSSEK